MGSWAEAAEAVRSINGSAYPERADDDAFWLRAARRTFRERDDGQLETDYDPHIALAFADFDEDATPPDLTPLFQALSAKPVLSIRGGLSDILTSEGVAYMKGINPNLETATIENIGHAPALDEPDAWDAILDFLAKAD